MAVQIKNFHDLIGKKFNFNGRIGTVAEYDSWDTYLCTFEDGFATYFHLEDIIEWMSEEEINKPLIPKKIEVTILEL